METKIQKWGNSFGVRIPIKIIKNNLLGDGVPVKIIESNGCIVIKYNLPKKISLKKMINKINSNNIHKEIDMGDVCGNEIW